MTERAKITAGYGARVRLARESRGVSAAETDRLADLTIGHTAKIEADDRGVTIETAVRHAQALGVRLDYLATGEAPMNASDER